MRFVAFLHSVASIIPIVTIDRKLPTRFGCALAFALIAALPSAAQTLFDDDPYDYPLWNVLNRPLIGPERGRFEVNYVYWYLQKLRVPPLVATGPEGSAAIVGDPDTLVLRGSQRLKSRHGRFIGFRNSAEYWLSDRFGIDATVFILERDSSNLTYRHHTYSPLVRPYIDAATGEQRTEIIAGFNPGVGDLAGSINVYSRVEVFGQDTNILIRLAENEQIRVHALFGARFLQMRERLDITATSRIKPAEAVIFGQADHIQTFMKFFGGQTGLAAEVYRGNWFVGAKGTLALGADVQIVRAKGDRVVHTPQGRETADYGLYVLPSNTGHFERTVLDFVTDWQFNIGYMLTPRLRTRIGYSLMTWNNPVRPGDQIVPIDMLQIENGNTALAPKIPFRSDFFWAQGLNFGFDLKW